MHLNQTQDMGSCFSSSSSSRTTTRMVDYYYSPALYDYDKVFGTSDESYATARDLRFQEALPSSLISSLTAEINHHPQLQRNIATCFTIKQEEAEIKPDNDPSRRLCYCMLCLDEKPSSDMFRGTTNCTHSYCTECTIRYVATKIEENTAMIKCPDVDCTRLIEPYMFRDLIPADVFERWDRALCESLILSSNSKKALPSSSISSFTAEINHHPQLQRNIATCITIKQEEPEIKTDNDPSRRLCYCMICLEEKPSSNIFRGTTKCTHSYCTECTIRYVATKIEENTAMIKCPDVDCTRLIEPYMFRDLIPADVFERWDRALCESLILSSEKVYCPFEDCSAMLVVDDDYQGNDAKVRQTECPSCHRLFCAQCKVTWHAGIGCDEFQSLGNTTKKSSDEEDDMLIHMAKKKQWRRCPSCKFYVEKVDGCMHIHCRCGFQFCYGCGSVWNFQACRCTKTPILRRIFG